MVWHTDMAVSPSTFEEQIRVFTKKYYCVSVKEYIKRRENITKYTNRKLLVITFDDGYIDNYLIALPILDKYNAKASFFLIGSHIDINCASPIHLYNYMIDQCTEKKTKIKLSQHYNAVREIGSKEDAIRAISSLKRISKHRLNCEEYFISKEQAKTMHSKGFEIGAHGYFHLKANAKKLVDVLEDYRKSKKTIIKITFDEGIGFAFPYGNPSIVGNNEIKTISSCGFEYALTTYEGLNKLDCSKYKLFRIPMEEVPLYATMFRLTGIRGVIKNATYKVKFR